MRKFDLFKLSSLMMAMMLALTFGLQSCSDDDDDGGGTPAPTRTAYEILENTAGLDSAFKYFNAYPDLVNMLQDSTITLFAPDNDAFVSLLATPGFPPSISLINPEIIHDVLAYHIVPNQVLAKSDLDAGDLLQTANQLMENIEVNPGVGNPTGAAGTLFTGSTNAEILIKGNTRKGTNGNVNVTESVLIPPSVGATLTPILGTNAGTVLLGADFSILAQGVLKADAYADANSLTTLVSVLAGPAVHTVFGPTNETFDAAGIGVDDLTGEQWYGTILNHVVLSDVAPADLTDGSTWPTATGQDTLYTVVGTPVNGAGIFFDSNGDYDPAAPDPTKLDGEVALPDAAINSNGRVHVIAGILLPK